MIEWNKNSSSVCEIKGKRVISKNYEKPIFLRRELFFYDLFQKNPLIRTPKIYSSDRINLKTHFIESEEKDVFKTAEEWAKVHSYFMKHPQKHHQLFIQHDIREVTSYILRNIGTFWELGLIVRDRLSDVRINRELTTLLHGDLQKKNMVTFQGNNYYFDFELGGIGHPCRDIASMIISSPDKKDELVATYKQNIDFNYPLFEDDVDNWLLARTSQLYIIFDKREGTAEQKKTIKGQLSKIIQGFRD